jgi:hypothetical protein
MKDKSMVTLATLLGITLATAPAFSSTVPAYLTGQSAQEQVHKLTGEIHWCQDLTEAERQAQSQKKMIVWIHMLGRIDGAT